MRMSDKQLKRLTPEELLVVIMDLSAAVTRAAADCNRFGWDLKFGTGTNNETLMARTAELRQVTKIYFLKTRRGDGL